MISLVEKIKNSPDAFYGSGISEYLINAAERDLHLRFSSEYRDYLLSFSIAAVAGIEFTGLCETDRTNVVKVTFDKREIFYDIPDNMYVVEDANIDGIVVWQDTDGSIYTTGYGLALKKVASSLVEYLSNNS